MWSSKTQPTPANIRKRITAAEEAVQGALVLLTKNERLDSKGGPRVPLQNALAWLQDGFNKTKR
jgi:hypothetical protein